MSFFAVNLVAQGEYTQEVPEDISLELTHITIAYSNAEDALQPKPDPILIQIEYEDKSFALCVLRPGKVENDSFSAVIPPGSEFVIRHVSGHYDVSLHGTIVEDEEDLSDSDMELEEGLFESDMESTPPVEELSDEEEAPAVPKSKKSKKNAKVEELEAGKNVLLVITVPQQPKTNVFVNQGVKIEEVSIGNGKKVKNGSRVSIHYVGRNPETGKVFDKSNKKPLTFTVGNGEVVRGMDLGLHNMKVGGKRTITIPPSSWLR
ncbi:hypothetical protein GEMRC1_013980 [Eukaryota sp. GEM-RC1]